MSDEERILEEVVETGKTFKKFEGKNLSETDIQALKKIGKWEE